MWNRLEMTWSALKEQKVKGCMDNKVVGDVLKGTHLRVPHGNKCVNKLDIVKLNNELEEFGYLPLVNYSDVDLGVFMMLEVFEYVKAKLIDEGVISNVLGLKFAYGDGLECTHATIISISSGYRGNNQVVGILNTIYGFVVTLSDGSTVVVPLPEGVTLGGVNQGGLLDEYLDTRYWIDDYMEIRGQQLVEYILRQLQG